MSATEPGDYRVDVIFRDFAIVLTWSGYADNITDALYHAVNLRADIMNEESE